MYCICKNLHIHIQSTSMAALGAMYRTTSTPCIELLIQYKYYTSVYFVNVHVLCNELGARSDLYACNGPLHVPVGRVRVRHRVVRTHNQQVAVPTLTRPGP